MDRTTGPGLILGFGAMIGMVLIEGGELHGLLNTAAAVIVFGGTLAALLISFPLSEVSRLPKLTGRAFGAEVRMPVENVDLYVRLAEKARKEGLLALEQDANALRDRIARKGLMLVVDGIDPEMVRSVLEGELEALKERHERGAQMMEAMGGYAPTMGILGTVMGLVHVLSQLSEPAALGESIAAAFVATLYGVGTANILWLPLGNKLKAKSNAELSVHRMTLDAVLAIQAGDNPRIVREKLEVHLPPGLRSAGKGAEPAKQGGAVPTPAREPA